MPGYFCQTKQCFSVSRKGVTFMGSFINRYKLLIVALALVLVLLPFSPSLIHWLTDGSQGGSQNHDPGHGSIIVPQASTKPLTIIQYCRDTKPLYTLGHEADRAVANKLDAGVNYDTGATQFYGSYIASSSYEDNAVSFFIPSVAKALVPPSPPHYG